MGTESVSIDTEEERREVNHEAFLRAEEDAEELQDEHGFARLIDCKGVKETYELPEDYTDSYSVFTWEHYLVFEAELADGASVTVVSVLDEDCAEAQVREYWSESETIGGLAGKTVPVRHVEGDVYRVEEFNRGMLNYVPLPLVDRAIEAGLLSYSGGDWERSQSLWLATQSVWVLSLGVVSVFWYIGAEVADSGLGGLAVSALGCVLVLYALSQLARRTE